jgi:hypothetical protein
MKKIKYIIVLCVCFLCEMLLSKCYSQHSVSIRSGVSFPVGNFAKTNFLNVKAFAKPGTLISVGYKYKFPKNNVSLVADITWLHYPYNEKKAAEWETPPPVIYFSATNYNFWMSALGAMYRMRQTGKIEIDGKLLFGVANQGETKARYYYPATNQNSIESISEQATAFVYKLGIDGGWPLSKRIKLIASIDFFHSTFRPYSVFSTSSFSGEKIRQDVSAFSLSMGVSYLF